MLDQAHIGAVLCAAAPAAPSTRIGIDLVDVGCVRDSVRRHGSRYLERVYTEREVADCGGAAAPDPQRLAARFAAKEAAFKVLRPARADALPWRTVEVVRRPGGWTTLELHAEAAALAARSNTTDLAVSLTHDGEYACAAVIAGSHQEEAR